MAHPSSAFSPTLRSISVGSTATSGLSRDEAKHLFERTQQRWSQTNDQLHSAILQRTISPPGSLDLRQKDFDITTLRQQLAEIQNEMVHYRQQLQLAEATIMQQQVTIRNQSKAIENPRPVRDNLSTPRHQHNNHNAYGVHQDQSLANQPSVMFQGQRLPYGAYQQPQSQCGLAISGNMNQSYQPLRNEAADVFGNHSTGHTPQANTRHGTTRVNEYGSPEDFRSAPPTTPGHNQEFFNQFQRFGYNLQNAHDPFGPNQVPANTMSLAFNMSRFPNLSSFASPESVVSNPYPESSLDPISHSVVLSSNEAYDLKVRESIQRVFDMAQQYAFAHANFPSTIGDNSLPKDIKERVLNAATASTAFPLMSDRNTRYLLVAKLMIQWIMKHIIKQNTFAGLDHNIDQIINGTKAAIYQSTPAAVRYLMLTNIANEVKKLCQKPNFSAFTEHLSQQRANQLSLIVRPLMHQKTVGEWANLVSLMRESYKLAELIFTSTDEFSFHFPTFNNWFDASEMISIDAAQTTQHGGRPASVRLGATPVVKFRKNMSNLDGKEQVLLKAKVILKKAG